MVMHAAVANKGQQRSMLYIQVLCAVVAGALLGWLEPAWGVAFKPLGDVFVKLIKMLIGPIVFITVTLGIAHMQDMAKIGRVGLKAVIYFEAITTVALLLGLGVVHLVEPGVNIHAKAESLDASTLDTMTGGAEAKGFAEKLVDLIPDSPVGAIANGDILQVLLVALLVGIALAQLQERGKQIEELLVQGASLMFGLVGLVMRFAPIGAFGAMAFAVGKYGPGTLGSLAKLMVAFYMTTFLFIVVVLGFVCALLRLSIFRLLHWFREELTIVLGTSSSESVLPRIMDKLEKLGCGRSIVRLVVPAGYSLNLDGTAIYLIMASVFVGQALDTPLTVEDEVSLFLVLLFTSKGAAITGGGFAALAATLSSTSVIPMSGLTLLLGIDRFMSEARALTNMVGNVVAGLVVARWEGELDITKAQGVLAGKKE
jgi:aerobic C4-dicarboxylate transport protein